MTTGLVLFAHGARDPRWAEPFERLRHKVAALRPDAPVKLAFLESMAPDLPAACAALVAQGALRIRIVPIFLGQGGHVRQDLPALAAQVQALYPAIPIELAIAIGDDDAVLDRIAAVCVGGSGD